MWWNIFDIQSLLDSVENKKLFLIVQSWAFNEMSDQLKILVIQTNKHKQIG